MAWPECSVDFADNAAATPPGSASTADRITGGVASLDPRLIARTPAGVPGLLFGEMTVIGCPRQKVRCSVSMESAALATESPAPAGRAGRGRDVKWVVRQLRVHSSRGPFKETGERGVGTDSMRIG